jgi:hypothetical protein
VTTFNDRRVAAARELSTMISGEAPLGSDPNFFAANFKMNSYGLSGGQPRTRNSYKKNSPITETTSVVDMR